jgi:Mn2+/Fe2+ NRAMP family transporter
MVMYFIILTTAATLHAQGKTSIDTAQQAAEALKPLAGKGAYLLFTLGLIGTGMLGVPVLAGAAAYAIAEARVWTWHARRQAASGKEKLCGRSGFDAVGFIA